MGSRGGRSFWRRRMPDSWPASESGFARCPPPWGPPGRRVFFIRSPKDHMFVRITQRGHVTPSAGIKRGPGAEGRRKEPTGRSRARVAHRIDMDPADYHHQQQHQFLMPPPASLPGQQLCVPMMDMGMDEQQFLMGSAGGAAGRGRGRSSASAERERKRRFTEEQIRSLESMFHAHHAKLEPREKAELARELGLQPRQVAIWFQNKRARWRSKQLEHDFAALQASYDALLSRVDSLKQDKLALAAQLHELRERLREKDGSGDGGATTATASSSSCNGGGRELDDDKRNVEVELHKSCVLGGTATCATPADVSASVESDCDDCLHYDGAVLPESFCATPELWEPWPWPPVEWNAVA